MLIKRALDDLTGLEVREHFLHSIRIKEKKLVRRISGFGMYRIIAAALLTGFSGTALTQDAGALLREQQRQQELQKPERLPKPEETGDKQAPLELRLSDMLEATPANPRDKQTPPETGETLFVRELRFTGKADLLPPAERERFAAALRNKRAGIADFQALADEVTALLQKQGHLLARAALPPQDVTAGVVTLDIAEGALQRIDIERSKGARIREELLRAIGHNQVQADSVTRQALEEALLRMNDLPGVTARAALVPGTASNTSRLVVGVEQAPLWSAALWGDNYGGADTGRTQSNALVTLADLTGLGEQTRFTGIVSEGQKFGQAEASLPWGASGFTARASYGYLAYRNLDGLGRIAGLEGFARYAGVGLDYGVIRSRGLNLRLSTGLNWKALIDDASAGRLQDKRALSGNFALAGDFRDALGGGALTNWSLDWTWGNLDLSRVPAALAVDAAGLKTQGNYQRLSAGLARLQALPGNFAFITHIYGQWASKNLDSSEDFALGGPYGVRGWPVGEGRGDMGLLGTVELRYDAPVPAPWGQVQLSAFLDGGRVRINRNPNGVPLPIACGCNAYGLAGAGLGMRWTRQNLSLAAFYAHGLGDNPGRSIVNGANADGRTSRPQFWLQGAIRF